MSIKDFFLRFFTYVPIQIGHKAPRLSLTAHDGTWVRSEDFFDETFFILFFFPSFSNSKTENYLQQIETLDQELHRMYRPSKKNVVQYEDIINRRKRKNDVK